VNEARPYSDREKIMDDVVAQFRVWCGMCVVTQKIKGDRHVTVVDRYFEEPVKYVEVKLIIDPKKA
jgi:hypothetical protein